MSNYIGNGEVDVYKNPHNMFLRYRGRKMMFFDLRTNHSTVNLNTDVPGNVLNAKITKFQVDDAASPTLPPYYQIDFGSMIHSEDNLTYGSKPSYIPITSTGATGGTDMTIPIRFYNDHIPQRLTVTIFKDGEQTTPITFGPKGCQIFIQYDFVSD